MVSEMVIKGKDSIKTEMVYQGETCAVGKAQPSIFKLSEDGLCSGFNVFGNPVDVDVTFVHLVHKLYGSGMASPHFEECVSFIQNVIGCVKNGFTFLKLRMNGFGL